MNRLLLLVLVAGSWIAASMPCRAQSFAISVPVRSGDCRETFSFRGELEACESVSIHAPDLRETNLMTIKSVLDDGTPVKKGDVVLEIDEAAFRVSLEAARQEFELANAEYDRIKFDLANEAIDLDLNIQRQELDLEKARVMVVEDSVAISKIDLQKAKLNVDLAKLEVEQAKRARSEFNKKRDAGLKVQELQVAAAKRKMEVQQENIDKSVVRAPKDGIVYKPFVRMNNDMGRIEPNKVVRPGDKLLELPNMDRFQGVIYIPSPDYSFIHAGEAATVSLTIRPESPFRAKVIEKEIYPVSRNERLGRSDAEGYLKEYKVVLELSDRNPDCRPGMTFQASVESLIASNCLYIPRVAVLLPASLQRPVEPGDQVKEPPATSEPVAGKTPAAAKKDAFVWLKGNGGPEKRLVTVGRSGVSFVEVISGLSAGTDVYLDYPSETSAEGVSSPTSTITAP